ncbi:hypothetical protein NHX12_017110, partial [Muraenolepis orangiensis]
MKHPLPTAEAQARLTQLVREDGEVEQPGATGEEEIADNVGVELAETSCKKARLESDFAQLFGAHFESSSKKKRVNSDADDELRDYCQRTPHIPTMDNPLEWWAENTHRFPRFRGATWLFQPQAPRVRGFFPWQATLSPDSGQASFPHMSMCWRSSTQTKYLERWTLSWRT